MTAVQLRFASITNGVILFNVFNFVDNDPIATDLSVVDITEQHSDWQIMSTVHPLTRQVPEVPVNNTRDIFGRIQHEKNELNRLSRILHDATDSARYAQIEQDIRAIRNRQKIFSFEALIATMAVFGVYPRELTEMGV